MVSDLKHLLHRFRVCLPTGAIAEPSVCHATFQLDHSFQVMSYVVKPVNFMGMNPLLHFLCYEISSLRRGNSG